MKILFILLISVLLFGCASNDEHNGEAKKAQETTTTQPPHQPYEPPYPICQFRLENPPEPLPPINLHIALADDDFLATFTNVYEVDEPRNPYGHRVAFWADVPLYDFALLQFISDYFGVEPGFLYFPTGTVGMIDVLPVGDVFVINGYIGSGTFPTSGVTFVDGDGNARFFVHRKDNGIIIRPHPFDYNFLSYVVDGFIHIYVSNQADSRWDIGNVLVDIENFDPNLWLDKNRHLWKEHLFFLWDVGASIRCISLLPHYYLTYLAPYDLPFPS